MKINSRHFQEIKDALVASQAVVKASATKYQEAGLSPERYMWDAFRFAKVQGNTTKWMCEELYKYLDDSHITTALKTAFSELGFLSKNGSEVVWTANENLDLSSKTESIQDEEPDDSTASRFAG